MKTEKAPLAHLVRPTNLDEFVGQEHLVGLGKPLRKLIESGELSSSIILWGPPGSGKTTIARLMTRLTGSEFVELSAVSAGKKDIEKVVNRRGLYQKRIVLFLDEIHRFNKAQQDFLLPFVEKGVITLIGATTENPSFEVISALLSRSRVFVLNQLSEEELLVIINNVMKREDMREIDLGDEDRKLIARLSNGDARAALNIIELSISLADNKKTLITDKEKSGDSKSSVITEYKILIKKENIQDAVQKSHLRYDKDGEEHYNIISAMHKSLRDSDVDASVYWVMRMIEAGEDPKYIIRRMIRFASEDIGIADSNALVVATAAKDAVEFLGYPECDTALIQTAVYLAKAPKSNEVYEAVQRARKDIERTGNLPVPMHLRNSPTRLMKELGYGRGYKYAHDYKDAKVEQEHMPGELKDRKYYGEK